LCLGIKAEVSGQVILASNNLINSLRFPACGRILVSLPLPHVCRFVVEITADVRDFRGTIERGFVAVSRHQLVFEMTPDSRFVYATQKMFAGDHNYTVTVSKTCETEELAQPGVCLTCMEAAAEIAVAVCGHPVVCRACSTQRAVRLQHCPVCQAIASLEIN
jgi:hypothetical protein